MYKKLLTRANLAQILPRKTQTADGKMESLPEGCISTILSLTSPRDACRMTVTAKTFRSAADSDTVWLNFLPSDYRDIISRSASSEDLNRLVTKKDLYLHLCDSPVLIDGGEKSFFLDKWSGKKCYMMSSRSLYIVWSDTPEYWEWNSLPESRFAQVAELRDVCWLEIRGNINLRMLSPATKYAVYLVYKLTTHARGFNRRKVEAAVETLGVGKMIRTSYLNPNVTSSRRQNTMLGSQISSPSDSDQNYPKRRNDGWLEIELGEYLNEGGMDQNLDMSLEEVKSGQWKSGLVIEGIEIRPKA